MAACAAVRESTARVAAAATHVAIDDTVIAKLVDEMPPEVVATMLGPRDFDVDEIHFLDASDEDLTARYLLCVDAINFCFWPDHDGDGGASLLAWQRDFGCDDKQLAGDPDLLYWQNAFKGDAKPKDLSGDKQGLEYEHVAGGLKRALTRDDDALDVDKLKAMTGTRLRELLKWPRPLPLEEERARLLREVGTQLDVLWDGSAAKMIRAARQSAPALVDIVAKTFPGFRDVAVYARDGMQCFLYKRAQIFVGDVWGRFGGTGLGDFADSIKELTMFADYRVPVVLRNLGVLRYDENLSVKVDRAVGTIPAGSDEEVEIRACSVQAVERIRALLEKRLEVEHELQPVAGLGPGLTSVAIDWYLWGVGEKDRDEGPPHHRTITVFY